MEGRIIHTHDHDSQGPYSLRMITLFSYSAIFVSGSRQSTAKRVRHRHTVARLGFMRVPRSKSRCTTFGVWYQWHAVRNHVRFDPCESHLIFDTRNHPLYHCWTRPPPHPILRMAIATPWLSKVLSTWPQAIEWPPLITTPKCPSICFHYLYPPTRMNSPNISQNAEKWSYRKRKDRNRS